MNSSNDHLALSSSDASQLVPASFAEKAMASLMQLHTELMDEKERRVDLFRRLMEREQALAELKMYVKLLEEKVAAPAVPPPAAAPQAVAAPAPQPHPPPPAVPFVSRTAPAVRASFPHPPRPMSRPVHDGWKTW
jgi:hypothetical protein